MSAYQPYQGLAGGTIAPSSFIKQSTAADNTFLQCGANGIPVGVAQVGQKNVPGLLGSNNAIAAETGDNIMVYPPGSVCPIMFSGTVGAGAYVKSDANGFAVAANANDIPAGFTEQAGAANTFGQILVLGPGGKAS